MPGERPGTTNAEDTPTVQTTSRSNRRRLSGFCNPTLPRSEEYDPHTRCNTDDCECDADACPCAQRPAVATSPDGEPPA